MSDAEVLNQTAQGQLRSIIERAERLDAEKAEISEHLKGVMAEAKSDGYCPKAIRKVLRIRKQDRAKRLEEEAILDTYCVAMGIV